MSSPEQVHGSHGRPRTHPIGRRIVLLLAIPLVSLVALWAFSAVPAVDDALTRFRYADNHDRVGQPSNLAMQAVQEERDAGITALTSPTTANMQRFKDLIGKTDRAVDVFRKAALSPAATDQMPDDVLQRTRNVANQFDQLASVRSQITARNVGVLEAVNAYSQVFDNTVRLLTTLVTINDIGVYQQTNGVLYMYWARDFMLREDLLLTSLRGHRLKAGARAAFARWAGARAELLGLGQIGLDGQIAQTMSGLVDSPAYADYVALEEAVVQQGRAPDPQRWQAATKAAGQVWLGTTFKAGELLQHDEVDPAGQRIMLRVYLAGGVGLAAVIASIVLSLLFARRHAGELRRLQRSAQELANERLPRVVARLRRGDRVDLDAETPRPPGGRTREVALVGEAFETVQRTAISTAIGEAELRASINRVFVNLSWRSQSLLHRQLRLLDQMERRASSPEELDDLFRLDHLTTRMRRHAEGLVILSGSPTVRAWDHPVAAEDVVRAAVAEIEDYTRIEVTGASAAAVTGDVVADVIHLLAELIENATAYSPPTTEVTVKIESVANGLAVEVIDRGIGLQPDELHALNRRLAHAGEFDLVDTERLGLFVVARLAARHEIMVSLQPSPYGGTTAIVLVPHALVVPDDQLRTPGAGAAQAVTAGANGGGAARLGRPARPALPGPAGPAQAGPPDIPVPPAAADPPVSFNTPGRTNGRARPAAEEPEPAEAQDSEVTGRLPRRVRQRNLAPQLRRRPVARHPEPAEPADDDFEEPSPELSRDLMASLQSGWLRGRVADDEQGDLDPRDERGDI
ncbi:sensor histidine kinase [Actinomadura darangshiensis]|uniref:histidine kinase n=1 Tax=Actinomadura darangshiensis TaxID=705336 RepID=A0A4R5BLP7_9ACTN|nr:sensor histidine kinase [Actinomadura darangshiensis]TDD86206.1 sensor histidine kinase [Actinomadura darangshiensis]